MTNVFARLVVVMVVSAVGAAIGLALGAHPMMGAWSALAGWLISDEGVMS